ncbi:MAG: hypothetical protein QG582_1470 [Candidatus Thermoplasmatota archaeon]|nr:hypothetical protein [Candidatus Thermoplasmatota archaeon]
MGKATGVGSIVFGAILILLGIGAWASGEAARSDNGMIAVGIAIILGLAAILGGVSARDKETEKAKQVAPAPQMSQTFVTTTSTMEPPPPPDAAHSAFCPYCGRGIQTDYAVCPFCGKSVKNSCPKCGKEVKSEFVACPYCGTPLKGT